MESSDGQTARTRKPHPTELEFIRRRAGLLRGQHRLGSILLKGTALG
jgi:hypothetical protein